MAIQDNIEFLALLEAIQQSESALNNCINKDYLPKFRRLHVWNLANLGDALYQAGAHAEALGFYIQAIKVDCDEPSVLNQIGVCLVTLGKIERALYYFDLLIRRADNPSDKGLAYFNTGICHKISGNINEAIISLRKSIRCFPDDEAIAELDALKELNSMQAFRHFKNSLFSKNVLSAPTMDSPESETSKKFGRQVQQ